MQAQRALAAAVVVLLTTLLLRRWLRRRQPLHVLLRRWHARAARLAPAVDRYGPMAAGYDRLHREEQLRKVRHYAAALPTRPKIALMRERMPWLGRGERLLDVGCGTAFSLPEWERNGADVVGAEPSAPMIAQALPGVRERVVCVPAEHLVDVFGEGEFDTVVSVTAVQNFTDIDGGVAQMRRVCRGRAAISVLKRQPELLERMDRAVRREFHVRVVYDDDVTDRLYVCY